MREDVRLARMTQIRRTALAFLVLSTTSLAVLTWTRSLWIALLASAVFAGSVLMLARSFWRLGQTSRQADDSRFQALSQSIDEAIRGPNGVLNGVQLARDQSAATSARLDAFGRGIVEEIAQVQVDLAHLESVTTGFGTELKRGLDRAADDRRRGFERADRDRKRLVGQVDGIVALYSIFKPSVPFPPFGGWAIAGDLARRYVSTVLDTEPRAVIEVGSGLSTVLCAMALELNGGEGQVYALEHEEHWMALTMNALAQQGVLHRAKILHAPLVETKIESEQWMWYDLGAVDLPDRAEILLVDGPPQSTGDLARYPALPLLIDRLSSDALIFLDDGIRPDEQSVLERWLEEIPGLAAHRVNDTKESIEIRRIT
jgi:Methyltransferase domain